MHIAELQHKLMEAQGRLSQGKIKPHAARCQQQKGFESLSKIAARELDLDEDELELFDQCVIEQREKGKSRIRARRICEDMIMEEREGSTKGNEAARRRKFLGTGILPKANPGVFNILQR